MKISWEVNESSYHHNMSVLRCLNSFNAWLSDWPNQQHFGRAHVQHPLFWSQHQPKAGVIQRIMLIKKTNKFRAIYVGLVDKNYPTNHHNVGYGKDTFSIGGHSDGWWLSVPIKHVYSQLWSWFLHGRCFWLRHQSGAENGKCRRCKMCGMHPKAMHRLLHQKWTALG